MLKITQEGSWKATTAYLKKAENLKVQPILLKYGSAGVVALANATPKDSSLTASSWDFKIETTATGYSIEWFNTNVNQGANIAILIQYGHGTGTGGYVPPRDYINPAMKPIFDNIAKDIWKEVSNL